MGRFALVMCVFAGCGYPRPPDVEPLTGDDASPPVDIMPDGSMCFGSSPSICLIELPMVGFSTGGANLLIDTSVIANCAPSNSDACVLAGTTITIDGNVSATGDRPLILIATDGPITILVGSILDVSSHRNGQLGPGADVDVCTGTPPGTGGGGAGGTLGGIGGSGGGGNGLDNGGIAGTPPLVTTLRGGCPGQVGGALAGASGGGAVRLISINRIDINGTVDASGAGGGGGVGGAAVRGGSGGGSGGMVWFDAPLLDVNGSVFAQGGGGGEGNTSAGGDPGADPTTAGVAASGGSGGAGGNGGNGATAGAGQAGADGQANGGGGGGGGTGLVRATTNTTTVTGTIVPAISG